MSPTLKDMNRKNAHEVLMKYLEISKVAEVTSTLANAPKT